MDSVAENAFCTLCLHRQALGGAAQDYIISFKEDVCDIETVLGEVLDVFLELMKNFEEDLIKARLIANVNYLKINEGLVTDESVDYHFASYASEIVEDPQEFFDRHMSKILSRMDSFHENGSRLLLNKVKHLHISISKTGMRKY